MNGPPPAGGSYLVGQIVDGHVLAADGRWYRIEAPVAPPSAVPSPAPTVGYDEQADVFTGSLGQVMRLAMRAVQSLGWTVTDANDTLGLLVFETGVTWGSWSGVTGSLTFSEAGSGAWRATGTGKQNIRGGQTLAIDLGEAEAKVHKVIERMVELGGQQ